MPNYSFIHIQCRTEDARQVVGQNISYLDRTTGSLHFVIDVVELAGELVHNDGVLEGLTQELVIVRHLVEQIESFPMQKLNTCQPLLCIRIRIPNTDPDP